MDFNKEIKEINEVTTEVAITIPVEQMTVAYENTIKSVTAKADIKGFRKGKAPRHVIEKQYGAKARYDAVNDLISKSLDVVIKEQSKNVIGQPEVDLVSIDPDKPIEYKAKLSFFPEPKIASYEKIEVKIKKADMGKDAVEKSIENIAKSKATAKPVEGRDDLRTDDVIKGKIKVASGDKEYSEEEPINFPVGEGYLPEKVEEKLIGMKVGETKEVELTKKEDENLLEDKVKYSLLLEELSEREIPAVTDEFVKELGQEGMETVDSLKANVLEKLEEQSKKYEEDQTKAKIVESLKDSNKFEVPEILIDHEIKVMLYESKRVAEDAKYEEIDIAPFKEEMKEAAEDRVKSGLIIDTIAKQEELVATREDTQKHFEEMAQNMGIDVAMLQQYYGNENASRQLMNELTRNKVWELLIKNTSVDFE